MHDYLPQKLKSIFFFLNLESSKRKKILILVYMRILILFKKLNLAFEFLWASPKYNFFHILAHCGYDKKSFSSINDSVTPLFFVRDKKWVSKRVLKLRGFVNSSWTKLLHFRLYIFFWIDFAELFRMSCAECTLKQLFFTYQFITFFTQMYNRIKQDI